MKTKEEIICEAWGDLFEEYEDKIDSDGFLHFKSEKVMETVEKTLGKLESHRHLIYAFRPKSLAGIENNNGWIKIENEKDLPEKTGDYFVYTYLGRLETFHYVDDAFSPNYFMSHVTHYQPIVKPKPPIY